MMVVPAKGAQPLAGEGSLIVLLVIGQVQSVPAVITTISVHPLVVVHTRL
jgi:hypothetical protein